MPEAPDNQTKRHKDRTGKDRTAEEIAAGFTNRLRCAEPGKPFKARPGTNNLPVDTTAIATIGDMVNLLVNQGVLARTDEEDVYTKQTEGLCIDPNGPKNAKDITELIIAKRLAALDLTQTADLIEFLEIQLKKHAQKLEDEQLIQTLLEKTPEIAKISTSAKIVINIPTKRDIETAKLQIIINNTIRPIADKSKQCRDIAECIIDAICNHHSSQQSK